MLANESHLNTAWRPCEVRRLFSRTICAMTLLRIFTAKPTHSHSVFTLWVYISTHLPQSHPFCSHWTNLPRKLLEVTSKIVLTHTMYAIAFKAAWELCRHWRFELILSRAETYHVFLKDYLVILVSQWLVSFLLSRITRQSPNCSSYSSTTCKISPASATLNTLQPHPHSHTHL